MQGGNDVVSLRQVTLSVGYRYSFLSRSGDFSFAVGWEVPHRKHGYLDGFRGVVGWSE